MSNDRRDPQAHYTDRAAAREARQAELARLDRALSGARGVTFLVAVVGAWLAVTTAWVSVHVVWPPAVAFVVLAMVHGKVVRERDEVRHVLHYLQDRLDRLAGRWNGKGSGPRASSPSDHPYAEDLDLFREGGVFDLLGPVATPLGARTLQAWLCEGAGTGVIKARQEAVAALSRLPDLAEGLMLAGRVTESVNYERLIEWSRAPSSPPRPWLRVLAFTVPLISAATLVWAFAGGPPLVPLVAYLGQAVFARRLAWRVKEGSAGVENSLRALVRLAPALGVLERSGETCFGNATAVLLEDLPSAELARLGRLVSLLDSRRNQLFALVAPALLWGTQVGLALVAWRSRTGPKIQGWCDTLGEFDSLVALGRHAWEHPTDTFPELIEGPGAALEATGLAHPLLPAERAIRNDLTLGPPGLLLISGSNMAGKSTLLRAVGVNLVLGMAGGVVRATSFRFTPLSVGSSIGVHDSLLDGQSRFHAEVLRLRQIVDASEREPVCFLLDELLSGTNSADRVAGATAVLRHLLNQGAIGLVTTHDLSLAHAVESLGARATQAHFEDQVTGDRMAFDYILRPGPLPRGNAMAVMRLVGLPVAPEGGDDR